MTQPARWSKSNTNLLIEAVEAAMQSDGFVCFDSIGLNINRSTRSCRQKAYGLGLLFIMKKAKRVVRDTPKPDAPPKPKYDMVNLPYHANGRRVNYL